MKALWMGLFFSASLLATDVAPTYVTCETEPGSTICKRMEAVKNSFGYTCTGAVCYQLWRTQIDEMNALVQEANYYLPYSFQADQEMGQLAWTAADLLCRSNATGAYNWIAALFTAKVGARDALVNIQKRAGVASVRTCSLKLN